MKEKKVAIVQSCYIPWKGYFDLINSVDEFILFDDVQFTKRDWRNRNIIKSEKPIWLTIPVQVKGKFLQKIKDVEISEQNWADTHWKTIQHNYSRSKCFAEVEDFLRGLFQTATQQKLTDINTHFLRGICDFLRINTLLKFSMDYEIVDGKSERLLHLCKQANASVYLSGPSAKAYMDETFFKKNGVAVEYMDYSNYPEYGQLHPPFVHEVSIVDLICNEGLQAHKFLKTNPKGTAVDRLKTAI